MKTRKINISIEVTEETYQWIDNKAKEVSGGNVDADDIIRNVLIDKLEKDGLEVTHARILDNTHVSEIKEVIRWAAQRTNIHAKGAAQQLAEITGEQLVQDQPYYNTYKFVPNIEAVKA